MVRLKRGRFVEFFRGCRAMSDVPLARMKLRVAKPLTLRTGRSPFQGLSHCLRSQSRFCP